MWRIITRGGNTLNKNRANNNEDGDVSLNIADQIFIAGQKNVSNVYTVFFDEPITDPSYYRNLLVLLNIAQPEDTIVFRIASPGGQVDSMLSIVNAIQNTEAHTVSVIESCAASAASMPPMVTDTVIAMPHSYMMIHAASMGMYETQVKVKKYVDFWDTQLRGMYKEIYKGFLTEEEIESMITNSEDLLFTADEVIERLQKREENAQAILLEDTGDLEDVLEDVVEKPKRKSRKKKETDE